MKSSYDVLIAGAGIVGAACALELAKAKMRVAVVDRSFPASGATGASMGHIVAMDDSEAQFALTRYSQELWHELRDTLQSTIDSTIAERFGSRAMTKSWPRHEQECVLSQTRSSCSRF